MPVWILILSLWLMCPAAQAVPDQPLWPPAQHPSGIQSIAVSPDGRIVATGGQDGTIRLWSPQGEFMKTLSGHAKPVHALLFHPDGQRLFSGGEDGTVRIWSLSGLPPQTQKVTGAVFSLALFPDGERLLVGADEIHLVTLGKGVTRHWKSRFPGVRGLDVSPDGQRIVTADGDAVLLWDAQGRLLRRLTETETGSRVFYTPDGTGIVSTSDAAYLWNAEGDMIHRFQDDSDGADAALSQDGQLLALVGNEYGPSNPGITLYNLNGRRLTRIGQGHDFFRIALSPDRKTAYVAQKDHLTAWPVPELELYPRLHPTALQLVVFPQGGQWATGGKDGQIKIWHGQKRLVKGWAAHAGDVSGLAIAPDGRTLASAGPDGLKLWGRDGALIEAWPSPGVPLTGVTFSPDGSWLATGAYDGKIRLWKREQGVFRILQGHTGIVWSVAVHPDGQRLASASDDQTVRLWNVSGHLEKTLPDHRNWVWCVAFSPDGRWLASGGRDSAIRLWTAQGEAQRAIDLHNANSVFAVAFSPDSQMLVSGGSDSRFRLWRLDGRQILVRGDRRNPVYAVAFSAEGDRAAAAFHQGNVDWVPVPRIEPSPEPAETVTPPPLPISSPPAASVAPFVPDPQGGGGAILPQARVQPGSHVIARALFAGGTNSLLYGVEINSGDAAGLERGFFYQGVAQGGAWPVTRHMAGITAKLQFWKPAQGLPLALAVGGYGDMAGIVYDLIATQSVKTSHFTLHLTGEYDLIQALSLRGQLQFGAAGLGVTWRPWGPLFVAGDLLIPFRPLLPGTLDLTAIGGPMLGLSLGF